MGKRKGPSSDELNAESRQRSRLFAKLRLRGVKDSDLETAQRPSSPPAPPPERSVVYEEMPPVQRQLAEAREELAEAERKASKGRHVGFAPGEVKPEPRFDLSSTVSGFPQRPELPNPELSEAQVERLEAQNQRMIRDRELWDRYDAIQQKRREKTGEPQPGSSQEEQVLERIDELREQEELGLLPEGVHPDFPGQTYRRGVGVEVIQRRRQALRQFARYGGRRPRGARVPAPYRPPPAKAGD
jgi:hypothetical protein